MDFSCGEHRPSFRSGQADSCTNADRIGKIGFEGVLGERWIGGQAEGCQLQCFQIEAGGVDRAAGILGVAEIQVLVTLRVKISPSTGRTFERPDRTMTDGPCGGRRA